MQTQRLSVFGVAVVSAATLSGCYSYVPVQPEAVPPGEAVRIRLTPEEAARYDDLRLSGGRMLEGRIARVSDGAVTVETSVGVNDPQRGTRALMQVVEVPMAGVVELERRELDNARTAFVVAGAAAVVAAAVIGHLEGNQGDDDGPGGGTPEARRVPILRLRLPF